jgi:hypothetical protein
VVLFLFFLWHTCHLAGILHSRCQPVVGIKIGAAHADGCLDFPQDLQKRGAALLVLQRLGMLDVGPATEETESVRQR